MARKPRKDQNDEFRQARDDADAWLELYTDLYDFAPVGYFTLDRGGIISRANLTGSSLIEVDRSHLVNRRFVFFVSPLTQPTFNAFFESVFESQTKQICEVVLLTEAGAPIYVRIEAAVPRDGEECRIAVIDINERKQMEDAQSFLLQCGLPGSDEDFFHSLARYLGETLSMDFVCIDRLSGDFLSAQTVAVFFDGKFEDNVAYTLKETPCGDVVGNKICSFPSDVRKLFPKDAVLQEMVAEGYIGTTLWSFQGQPIGLIAMISRKPLTNSRPAELILQLVASRAASELERTQAEEEIKSLARFPSENPNPIVRISDDGLVLYANAPAELLLRSWAGAVGSDAPPIWREMGAKALENSNSQYIEHEHEGRAYAYYVVPISESGYVNLYAVDITERKQVERRQQLSTEILSILNESIALPDAINRVLAAIKQETGFDAVGMRLQNGDDFPYFAQNGFSDDFLLAENTLAVPAAEGSFCRNEDGSACLECTCGLVISGKTDQTNPLFTPGGSCWTNESLKLLDIPADQEPRLHPRNRCVHEGFLSVALIPIRANQDIVGLLQLNDRKKDRLTGEMVRYFEEVCGSIGLALIKKQAEEALAKSNKQVAQILESISDAFFTLDRDWRFNYVNSEAERVLLKSHQELIGAMIWDQFPEAVGSLFQTEYERAIREAIAVQFESYYPPFDTWFEVRAYPYEGGLSVYFRDCSGRKRAEEALAYAADRDRHIADVLQQALIPSQIPYSINSIYIAAKYQPALQEAEVGGDFYDVFELGDDKIGVLIGDVTGKGLQAAMQVAAARHSIRSYAYIDSSPGKVMTLANAALTRSNLDIMNAMTAFFAVVDTVNGTLIYANAGHEPPLICNADHIEDLEVTGAMFGLIESSKYSEHSFELRNGDSIVMFTDGITEAR